MASKTRFHLSLRREFLRRSASGLGAVAFSSLGILGCEGYPQVHESTANTPTKVVKNIIFLCMDGGPSQLDLFDYKPALQKLDGQPAPESITNGQRFAFMDSRFSGTLRLLGSPRQFARHGRRGTLVSELLPNIASIADDIAIVRSLRTDIPNHAPAQAIMNTGFFRYGRPSMGAWLLYALGSENQDFPGFVVLRSGPRGPRGGMLNWSSGFLPTQYQGVQLREQGTPILHLDTPAMVDAARQQRTITSINQLNRIALERHGDPEAEARIAAYELAGRMQLSAPEVTDLGNESRSVLRAYGAHADEPSFARNCLLARRLVERGVRFVQLYHTDWDHHGQSGRNLAEDLEARCHEVDRASAALVSDLKSRGLLDETLVVWGGEFGRTPMGEQTDQGVGRNHHIHAGAMWLAGGGIQPIDYGQTDELGFFVESQPMHVHDLHATMLHAMGLDHRALTFRSQGRDFRLTDTAGQVIPELLGLG